MRTPSNESLSAGNEAVSPVRKCILSGTTGTRETLIRLALSPEGDVLPDVNARAPGRGAWISLSRAELEKALAKGKLRGALMRAFKGAPLAVGADLPEKTEQALVRALTQRLGLELKAGNLLLGSDRIAESARSGRVVWLAHAADASADGSRKLDQAWRVGCDEEGTRKAGIALPLDRAALSVALGRDNVVHLALSDHAAAERVAVLLRRLLLYQGRTEAAGSELGERPATGAGPLAATN